MRAQRANTHTQHTGTRTCEPNFLQDIFLSIASLCLSVNRSVFFKRLFATTSVTTKFLRSWCSRFFLEKVPPIPSARPTPTCTPPL